MDSPQESSALDQHEHRILDRVNHIEHLRQVGPPGGLAEDYQIVRAMTEFSDRSMYEVDATET